MSDKHVYRFSEGNKTIRELLGGKGANLAAAQAAIEERGELRPEK
jgi:phosphoenolpyruvate synthase/pyruvate phosphate dikinase